MSGWMPCCLKSDQESCQSVLGQLSFTGYVLLDVGVGVELHGDEIFSEHHGLIFFRHEDDAEAGVSLDFPDQCKELF